MTNSKKMSDKQKYKKDSFTEKKRKAWNRRKGTQTPFTLTGGLAATDKALTSPCLILFLTPNKKQYNESLD